LTAPSLTGQSAGDEATPDLDFRAMDARSWSQPIH
jgi:hypothetical protein